MRVKASPMSNVGKENGVDNVSILPAPSKPPHCELPTTYQFPMGASMTYGNTVNRWRANAIPKRFASCT
eukprot:1695702-Pyramimonas_sp.AAC.1